MNARSRICPSCSKLNGPREQKCFHCGAPLRGPIALLQGMGRREGAATRLLIGICVANFLLMTLANGGLPLAILGHPPSGSSVIFVGGIRGAIGAKVELWRWLSATFVHLGVLHLGMNMLVLSSLGRTIEDSQGTFRMLVLYLVSGIVGYAASRYWYGPFGPTTAGASGAIFGLLGVRIAELWQAKHPGAREMLIQNLAYAAAFALLFSVNNAAHAGGFVAGFVLAVIFIRYGRGPAFDRVCMWLSAIGLLLALAAQVASAVSPYSKALREFESHTSANATASSSTQSCG